MTIRFVLDASALLAEIFGEPGADVVREAIPHATMSAVNLAEVVTRLVEEGAPEHEVDHFARRLRCTVEAADRDQAISVGLLHQTTRRTGISLGDRFCLALGRERGAPVLTADQRWASLDAGVEVRLIR